MSKFSLTVLTCLLFVSPAFAELKISETDRVWNGITGTCVWCSLEMNARARHIEALRGVAQKYKDMGQIGASLQDADNELNERNVNHRCYPVGPKRWDALDWAGHDNGMVIGVLNWPVAGCSHAILITDWDGKRAKFVCPNCPDKVWTVSKNWLQNHWTGWGIAIWP